MPGYYNTPEQLNEYLVFHYATDADILPWKFGPQLALGFHRRLVQCIDFSRLSADARALDLGCSVGRITFELARVIKHVMGIDFSHQFIETARDIQQTGEVMLNLTREGKLGDRVTRRIDSDIDRARITFIQGDAENLPKNLGKLDVLVLANVLDRLPHPKNCLGSLADTMNSGGQMIICSPFTWWDEFTEVGERLGGFIQGENEVTSLDTMKDILLENFLLSDVEDQPFLIREHQRKYHFSVAQTSTWIKKPD